jgi:hypothetical protein
VPNPFQPIPAGPALQQLEVIDEKFDEAFNKHDASAVAAFYTSNAILSPVREENQNISDLGNGLIYGIYSLHCNYGSPSFLVR